MVGRTSYSNTWNAGIGGTLQVQGQPGPDSEFKVSARKQNKKEKRKKNTCSYFLTKRKK